MRVKIETRNCEIAQGFALMELVLVVGVIGVLVSVATTIFGGASAGVKNVKLRSDVESLNEAVQVYMANGGSMAGVNDVVGAIAKLKKQADSPSAQSLVGLRGSMLDPRSEAQMMTVAEAGTAMPRALWDTVKKRFVYATEGAAGAKGFTMNQSLCGVDPLTEARETAVSYSKMTDWVWDYQDVNLTSNGGVTDPATASAPGDGPVSIVAAPAPPLAPPYFSLDGGLYDFFDFDLEVELMDPNLPGTAVIYYTLGDSQWQIYAGDYVLVGAGQELTAYAVSIDPDHFSDSDFVGEVYESSFTISGGALGQFSNPDGAGEMVTNLLDGGSSEFFSFGTAAEGYTDPSWLLFNGATFADVGVGVSFLLGTLDYFNGTIASGTQATSVGLAIDLGFNGGQQSLSFNYEFELISTPNLGANSAEENADFVRLGNLYSDVPVELGGVDYNLILEFGETTEGGFSTIDQFHVLENETASGYLYGRLVEAGDAGGQDKQG